MEIKVDTFLQESHMNELALSDLYLTFFNKNNEIIRNHHEIGINKSCLRDLT